MIFLYILLAIIIIIPFINIKLELIMHNNNAVLSINSFKIRIPPKKDKPKKKKRVRISIKDIFKIVKELFPQIEGILSKVRIDYTISIHFGFSDALETAIAYGIINSIVYGVEPILKNLFLDYKGNYSIVPDFRFKGMEYSLSLTAKLRLYQLIASMFKMLKVLKNYKKYIFKKGGVLNV